MKNLIYIVSFFIYSGYYVGLSFFYTFNITSLTRFYTVPLRLVLSAIMIYVIIKTKTAVNHNKSIRLLFVIFSVLYILKIMISENSNATLSLNWFEYILYYLSFVFIPFWFFSKIDFLKFKDSILDAIIFSGFLLGAISLITFKDSLVAGTVGRISDLTYETGLDIISPLALAYSGALTIVLCLYKIIYEINSKRTKIYLFTTMFLSFILFFLGSTRGALVSILLCLLVFLYYGNLKNKSKFIALFLIAAPIVIMGIELTGSSILERSLSTIETGDSSGREPLWNAAFNEFINNPIVGGRIEVSGIYPHNIFLEILMSTGLLGFMIYVLFLIKTLKNGFHEAHSYHVYIVPILILICGLTQHMVTGALWSGTMLFVALGILATTSKRT